VGVFRHVGGSFFHQGKDEIRRYLEGPRAILPGIVFARRASDAVGGFHSWDLLGDWDLELRLLQFGGVAYHDEILAQYRVWSNADRASRFLRYLEETRRLYEKTLGELARTCPELAAPVSRARSARARTLAIAAGKCRQRAEFREASRLVRDIHDSPAVRTLLWLSGCRWLPSLIQGVVQVKSALRCAVKALLYAS
jgi:hypothetical protein